MRNIIFFLIFLSLLASCGFEGEGGAGGGLVVGHQTVEDAFVLSLPNSGTYNEAENLNFILTHPKDITVNTDAGTPSFEILVGETLKTVSYVGGSGSKSLVFQYTVESGEDDYNGIELYSSEIDLNGATLQYSVNGVLSDANNDIVYESTATEVLVDTGIPTLLTVSPPIDKTYRMGEGLVFVANFDSPVVVTGTPKIQIDIGGVTRMADYYLGSGTSALLFMYQVQETDIDLDGVASTSPVDLTLGAIGDFGSNPAVVTFSAPDTSQVFVNGAAPYVTGINTPTDGTYYAGEYITFSLDFNEVVTIDTTGGTPRVPLTIGANTRYAEYYQGSGQTEVYFRYFVQGVDNDSNGIRIESLIDLNGGTIQDSSTNDAILYLAPPITPHVLVYGGSPSIIAITPPSDQDYVTGSMLSFDVKFSESISVSGTPGLDLTIGASSRQAQYTSGGGTDTLTFSYEVQAGDSDSDGISFANSALNLNGSASLVSSVTGINSGLSFTGLEPSLSGVTVNQQQATQIAITVEPADTTVSTNIPTITVEFRDASNNLVTSESSQITVAIGANAAGGTLSGDIDVNASSGVASFSDLQIDTVGNDYTLVFSTSGLSDAISANFNITAAGATKLNFVQEPTNALAGVTIAPAVRVEVLDDSDNRVLTAQNLITLAVGTDASNDGTASLDGTVQVAAVNGVAIFTNVDIKKIGSGYTLVASADGLLDATSSSFNISPNVKSQLAFSVEPANAEINATITPAVKVQIQDTYGNKTADTDLVTLSINNDPAGGSSLSGDIDIAAVSGEAVFSDLSLNQLGVGFTLDAAISGIAAVTSSAFDITTTPTKLVIIQQPSDAAVNAAIAPAITVQIQDASNNLVTSATNQISVAFGNDPSNGSANLGGTIPLNAVDGVATFSDISIDQAQTGYTLSFSADNLSSATSSSFNITAATATKLAFNVQPSTTIAGENITAAIEVHILDANDNLVTDATDLITLSFDNDASSGSASLGGDIDIAATGGIATFSDINIDKAFSGYTLSAAATDLTTAISSSFDITPAGANKLNFVTQPSGANQNTAISPSIEVGIFDTYDNLISSSSSLVTLSLANNPGGSSLSGDIDVNAVGGVASFSDIQLDNLGSGYTISAASSGLIGVISDSFNIYGTPSKLAFGTQPANTTLGNNLANFTVEIQDDQGNIITTDTRAVTIGFEADPSQGSANLSGDLIVSAVAGVATFSGVNIDQAYADYTFIANAGGLVGDTSTPFDIRIAAPTSISLNDPASSPSADATPEFLVGGVSSGDIVKLFTDNTCSSQVASFTATGASVAITTSTLAEGTYTIYANRSIDGNTSACSSVFEDYEVSGAFSELEQVGNGSFTYWTNVTGDDRDWNTESAGTPTGDVGPSAPAASTYYTYTEASNGVKANDVFILEYAAALDGATHDLAISFYWNKRGDNMGDLYLEASNDGGSTWSALWSHLGADIATGGIDVWRGQYVDICDAGFTSSNVLLRFRGVMPASGTIADSDMGLDEIEVNAGGCQPGSPASISLDDPAPSQVIGVVDMDAFTVSGTCSDPGQNITLGGDVSGLTTCQASGDWSYTLNLSAHADGDIEIQVDHTSASGGANGSDSKIYTKDSTTIFFDNFEVDFGNWVQAATDDGDWTINSGETDSGGVGPSDDQSGGGQYIYVEASNTGGGDEFIIYSDPVDAGTYNVGFDFYWNKRGNTMGDLYLEVSTDDGVSWDTAVWSHLGVDIPRDGTDVWNNETIDLCGAGYNSGQIRVRLRGVIPSGGARWQSDIGLDSLRFTTLGCP